jgi:hypothetical protein
MGLLGVGRETSTLAYLKGDVGTGMPRQILHHAYYIPVVERFIADIIVCIRSETSIFCGSRLPRGLVLFEAQSTDDPICQSDLSKLNRSIQILAHVDSQEVCYIFLNI